MAGMRRDELLVYTLSPHTIGSRCRYIPFPLTPLARVGVAGTGGRPAVMLSFYDASLLPLRERLRRSWLPCALKTFSQVR
eukprot:59348-Prorocentrum_minimum.AAC.1